MITSTMPQNKNMLSERISDWEANQLGLPNNSEIIWRKVELVLETKSSKKNKFPIYRYWVAAAIVTLFVGSIYLYERVESKTNQVVLSKKSPAINKEPENANQVIESSFKEEIAVAKNKKEVASHVFTTKIKSSLSTVDTLVTINNEDKPANSEILASTSGANATPEVITNILPPTSKDTRTTAVTIFWKPTPAVPKNKFRFPLIHANELNNPNNASKNHLTQFIIDEKPIPNFEVAPSTEVKSKWKITLHPTTKPISLTDHQ